MRAEEALGPRFRGRELPRPPEEKPVEMAEEKPVEGQPWYRKVDRRSAEDLVRAGGWRGAVEEEVSG